MSEWPIKKRLNENAVEEIDRFQQKYTERMKNTMYGMICHAYNQGEKDGRLSAESHSSLLEKYEEGYRKGLESNCGAYNLGYRKGQTELLDALKVIAKKFGPGGTTVRSYVTNCSAETIIRQAKYYKEEDEQQCETFHIGDEVEGRRTGEARFIITDISDDGLLYGISTECNIYSARSRNDWKKTGRHFDIEKMMKELTGDE